MASYKVWLLGIVLVASFLFLFPVTSIFAKGAMISEVAKNSTEFDQGLRAGMIIQDINGEKIESAVDYAIVASQLAADIEENGQMKITIKTKDSEFIFLKNESLDISVKEIPKTRIKTGLDLSGGARALIRPANVTNFSSSDMSDLIAITSERFNVYGLKDIAIKPVTDLEGNTYMLIEIAGATPEDLENLVGQQGKFEGKIGNETVFIGGQDISHVERAGQNAGIEGCFASQDAQGTAIQLCRFRFPISLTEDAAEKHAEVTGKLSISTENPEYLSEKLDFYIDDALMDSLFISKDLKGRVTTDILIQGSGTGTTQSEAFKDAQSNMNRLQTILITGSLPYKLEIVKLDTISPTLGKEFTKNLIILALTVFIIISAALFLKYRKVKITGAVILTMFSEAFITLGLAALIKWNLDAPSIAGIIAGMGTGVNDQIVIIDESISNASLSMTERIKRAFFIILGAFFTIIAAMLPLFWAGAGMLKGFALTTILSVLIGILITRPAFAEILKKIQG